MTESPIPFGTWVRHLLPACVIAALAGVLAFAGSFVVKPTYASSTRLLVRARDATFLSASGERVGSQPGIFDASLAKQLVDTEAALLTSQAVAERVVDDLNLSSSRPDRGAIGTAIAAVKGFLAHGFYAEPAKRDAAVREVQADLVANPVKDSYVLEIGAAAEAAKRAAAIANSAAVALIDISRDRFREDAAAHVDVLRREVAQAGERQAEAAKALQDARAAAGVSAAGAPSRPLTPDVENQLRELDAAQTLATAAGRSVRSELDAALASSQDQRVELTRLDAAKVPTYPVKPLRYLYLFMGGLCGLAIGAARSYRSMSRAGLLSTPSGRTALLDADLVASANPQAKPKASNGSARTPAMAAAAASAVAGASSPPRRAPRRAAATLHDEGPTFPPISLPAPPAKRAPRRRAPEPGESPDA